MAELGKWRGEVKAQGNLPETWTAPTNLFDIVERNDNSAYGFNAAASAIILPATNIADGYLVIASYEYHDTSNGRFNPQGRFIQLVGSGNFISASTGGYSRMNSEDRAYVRTWAIVDSPSASTQLQFQWKADIDDAAGGTERSVFEVIPLYYSNIGMYRSTNLATAGGTTPNQVIGFTGVHESDRAAIALTSNVVKVKTDNKRYITLGSQFYESRQGRTQRWFGLRINDVKDDSVKAYSYYRSQSDDEVGNFFTTLIDRSTADIDIDQFCYRGDGVANLQGGASIDGAAPVVGDHATVVIELHDGAEVFKGVNTANSSDLGVSPTDININQNNIIADSGSFTSSAIDSIKVAQDADYLFGANISCASNNVATGSRFTGYAELKINTSTDDSTVHGNYLRNNQGSADTFGLSFNLLSSQSLGANDDVGVTVTELAGSQGGGNPVSPAGWSGMWGLNLDTLQPVTGSPPVTSIELVGA